MAADVTQAFIDKFAADQEKLDDLTEGWRDINARVQQPTGAQISAGIRARQAQMDALGEAIKALQKLQATGYPAVPKMNLDEAALADINEQFRTMNAARAEIGGADSGVTEAELQGVTDSLKASTATIKGTTDRLDASVKGASK